jgi:hypothetical protein
VNVDREAFDLLRLHPRARESDRAIHVAVAFPIGIEEGRLIGDLDVLLERGNDRRVPGFGDERPVLIGVHGGGE